MPTVSDQIRSLTRSRGLPRRPCGHDVFSGGIECGECTSQGVFYSFFGRNFSLEKIEALKGDSFTLEGYYSGRIIVGPKYSTKRDLTRKVIRLITNAKREFYIKILKHPSSSDEAI